MVRNAVTVSAVEAACCTDAQKIEGNEVRFRLWIRCDTADNGVRAKNNPTSKAETICIPYSIAPARAEPNTPSPTSPMQKPGLAQLQKRFTRLTLRGIAHLGEQRMRSRRRPDTRR